MTAHVQSGMKTNKSFCSIFAGGKWKIMKKKLTAAALVAVLLAAMFTGCSIESAGTITFSLAEKIKSLDPALSKTKEDGTVVLHVFEGLTRLAANGKTVPGTALGWIKSIDGLKYTFQINPEAKWSDGVSVTANDFEYSWERVLNPKMASENAFQLYYIKNAKGYNMSEDPYYKGMKFTRDDVGIKALDAATLEVTLETPCTYWIDLTNLPVYMPVRQDIIEKHAQDWHASESTYIGNGAYKLKKLSGDREVILQKSKRYWDADNIMNSSIRIEFAGGEYEPAFEAFTLGKTDGAIIPVPSGEILKLTADSKLAVSDLMTSYYLSFNINSEPLNKPAVRKALALALNRSEIVKSAMKGVEKPASGLVPYRIPGLDPLKDFRTDSAEYAYISPEADITKARQLLTEAGYADTTLFPQVELIYEDTGSNRNVMQTIQAQWQKNLGISVKLTAYDANAFKSKKEDRKFNIAAESWTLEYNDPLAFLEMWTSHSIFNATGFGSYDYDNYILQARASEDNKVRMPLLHSAENLIMSVIPVCPLYFGAEPLLSQNGLKGVVTSPYGYVYFHYAYK